MDLGELDNIETFLGWLMGDDDYSSASIEVIFTKALINNNHRLCKVLLTCKKINVNAVGSDYLWPPLYFALQVNSIKMAKTLICEGATVNWGDGIFLNEFIRSYYITEFLLDNKLKFKCASYNIYKTIVQTLNFETLDLIMSRLWIVEDYKDKPRDYVYGDDLIKELKRCLWEERYLCILRRLKRWVKFHRKRRLRAIRCLQLARKTKIYRPGGKICSRLKRKHSIMSGNASLVSNGD